VILPAPIERELRQLDRLARDLTDGVRRDDDPLMLNREWTDLQTLARGVVERVQATTHYHRVRLVAPGVPLVGWWDKARLEQVLHHLLTNAVRYSPDGGQIVLWLTAGARTVRLSVSDEGLGIPADTMPHIFERFYRGAPTAGLANGLGLGLFVSRRLVEAHGGRIKVVSKPLRGSTFLISLPCDAGAVDGEECRILPDVAANPG
jgi:two-component system sensor histidine kinase MtrB